MKMSVGGCTDLFILQDVRDSIQVVLGEEDLILHRLHLLLLSRQGLLQDMLKELRTLLHHLFV